MTRAGIWTPFGFRPQDTLSPDESSADGGGDTELDVEVAVFENLLEFGLATVSAPSVDGSLVAQTPPDRTLRRGDRLRLTLPPERVYLLDPGSGERLR